MRYLSYFLGFSVLIVTTQIAHTLVVGQLSPSSSFANSLVAQETSVGDNDSSSRGSDRRDS